MGKETEKNGQEQPESSFVKIPVTRFRYGEDDKIISQYPVKIEVPRVFLVHPTTAEQINKLLEQGGGRVCLNKLLAQTWNYWKIAEDSISGIPPALELPDPISFKAQDLLEKGITFYQEPWGMYINY